MHNAFSLIHCRGRKQIQLLRMSLISYNP